jgi:hypothetical protein
VDAVAKFENYRTNFYEAMVNKNKKVNGKWV